MGAVTQREIVMMHTQKTQPIQSHSARLVTGLQVIVVRNCHPRCRWPLRACFPCFTQCLHRKDGAGCGGRRTNTLAVTRASDGTRWRGVSHECRGDRCLGPVLTEPGTRRSPRGGGGRERRRQDGRPRERERDPATPGGAAPGSRPATLRAAPSPRGTPAEALSGRPLPQCATWCSRCSRGGRPTSRCRSRSGCFGTATWDAGSSASGGTAGTRM
mmetsp:Transcript_48129/g.80975  ORF Transcript_48129/g.80975 Transcript_48129/m.80975 type:complete len:215 (-) Transcript_48129:311-955(-)